MSIGISPFSSVTPPLFNNTAGVPNPFAQAATAPAQQDNSLTGLISQVISIQLVMQALGGLLGGDLLGGAQASPASSLGLDTLLGGGAAATQAPSSIDELAQTIVSALKDSSSSSSDSTDATDSTGDAAAAEEPKKDIFTIEDGSTQAQRLTEINNAYIRAVDQNGNVNANQLGNIGDLNTNQEKQMAIVISYAAEFAEGDRIESAAKMQQRSKEVIAGLQSDDANERNKNIFFVVASSFKNRGGNYNNAALKQLLESKADEIEGSNPAGADQLRGIAGRAGVGNTDVQTLGAIGDAIGSGLLKLSDVFNRDTGRGSNGTQYVDNTALYNDMIDYVTKKSGDTGRSQFLLDTIALLSLQEGNIVGPGAFSNND